ncbi:MAG: M23 family metallopeptidase [Acidobacteria bacterium]|nr:M23 family metallopeptidase [Acidobacteriota bacterium]
MRNALASTALRPRRQRGSVHSCVGAVLLAAAALAAFFSGDPAWGAEGAGIVPGSIVRWSGEGIEGCSKEGRRWQPLDGACFFPISLTERGSVKVAVRRQGAWQEESLRLGPYPYDVQRLTIEDDSKVHLSKTDLDRVQKENRRIGALWYQPGDRSFSLPLAPPLDEMPPGGRFGSQRIINGSPNSAHSGADFAAIAGTPVKAVADGTVKLAEEHFFAGNSVFLDHGDELVSMYFHLSEILVKQGQQVRRGQVIAKVGSTGRSTGPHLHLGLRWHGAKVDPTLLLGPVEDLPVVGR